MINSNYTNKMFSENRVIYNSNPTSDDAATGAPENSTVDPTENPTENPDMPDVEAEDSSPADKEKLQKLVKNANWKPSTKKRANASLARKNNKKEIALLEDLIDGKITEREYIKKLNKLEKESKLTSIKEAVASRSKSIAALHELTIPQQEQQKMFQSKVSRLGNINKEETALTERLEKLLDEKKVDPTIKKQVVDLDPHDSEISRKLKEILINEPKLYEQVLQLKGNHKRLINQFEEIYDEVLAILQENNNEYQQKRFENMALETMRSTTGLNIREGIKLQYTSSEDGEEVPQIAQIKKISFEENPDIFDDDRRKHHELFVITSTTADGVEIENYYTAKEFIAFLRDYNVTELIEDQQSLENSINFNILNQKLKVGTKLEYVVQSESGQNTGLDATEIVNIDSASKQIRLSGHISLSPYGEAKYVENDTVLSFGEFSRWFNQKNAEEKVSLEQCRSLLEKMPTFLQDKYKAVDPKLFKIHTTPIYIHPGEVLEYGDNKSVTVQQVKKDDSIVLSNGKTLTPSQFLHFVKNYEVTRQSETKLNEKEVKKLIENQAPDTSEDDKTTQTDTQQGTFNEEDYIQPEPYAEKRGFLGEIWANFSFLSVQDIDKLLNVTVEFVKRRSDNRVATKAGTVGQNLPGQLGVEFRNIKQSAENTEVEKIKGELKEQGPVVWIDTLLECKGNTNILKATTLLLCETGDFNFEDPRIWKVYNEVLRNIVDDKEYEAIRIHLNGNVNNDEKKPIDALKAIISRIYGPNTGESWYNTNLSAYNGEMDKVDKEAINIALFPNGLERALHTMLTRHANGDFVSSARYEGFIKHIMGVGRSSDTDKIFFMMAGLLVKNPKTGTFLLNNERLSAMESTLMKNYPMLDYFTGFKPLKSMNILVGRESLRPFFNKFKFSHNFSKRFDNEAVKDFIWTEMNTHEQSIKRAGRVIEDGNRNIDHDDAQLVIPLLDSATVQVAMGSSRGDVGMLTKDGLANGLSGYSQFIKSLAKVAERSPEEQALRISYGHADPIQLLITAFKSFFIFDSALTGRVKYTNNFQPLSSEKLANPPTGVGGPLSVGQLATQVRETLRKVLEAYNVPEQNINFFLTEHSKDGEANKTRSEVMQQFPAYFDKLIREQGADKLKAVVLNAVNSGMVTGYVGSSAPIVKKERSENSPEPANDDVETINTDEISERISKSYAQPTPPKNTPPTSQENFADAA